MTGFNSEADLDASTLTLCQRQRVLYGKDIEFRSGSVNPYGLRVLLYGGPYEGRYGMVAVDQTWAWVISGCGYRRQLDGTWEWTYAPPVLATEEEPLRAALVAMLAACPDANDGLGPQDLIDACRKARAALYGT